jgi:hypothetical protein
MSLEIIVDALTGTLGSLCPDLCRDFFPTHPVFSPVLKDEIVERRQC